MACCGKRKAAQRAARARLTEAQQKLVEVQQMRTLRLLKDKEPSTLPTKLLIEYHRRTHMLYSGAMRRKPINKNWVNEVVDTHDQYVSEMLKRGIKHNTPLKKI